MSDEWIQYSATRLIESKDAATQAVGEKLQNAIYSNNVVKGLIGVNRSNPLKPQLTLVGLQ